MDHNCWIWQVGNPKPIKELQGHTESVDIIEFSHDGKICVTGGLNNQLRVWD